MHNIRRAGSAVDVPLIHSGTLVRHCIIYGAYYTQNTPPPSRRPRAVSGAGMENVGQLAKFTRDRDSCHASPHSPITIITNYTIIPS